MKTILKYSLLALVLSLVVAPSAHAKPKPEPSPDRGHENSGPQTAPEVDPALATTGLALLAGSLALVRARRPKAQIN
jgi:hypothetical protein